MDMKRTSVLGGDSPFSEFSQGAKCCRQKKYFWNLLVNKLPQSHFNMAVTEELLSLAAIPSRTLEELQAVALPHGHWSDFAVRIHASLSLKNGFMNIPADCALHWFALFHKQRNWVDETQNENKEFTDDGCCALIKLETEWSV